MASARILIVDDEPDIRLVLIDVLEDEGYEVHAVSSAEEADKAVRTLRPNLVLLDVWLPGEDGLALYRRWAQDAAIDMPVVMISGHGTIENAVEATQLGAYDFLEKPLSTAKLMIVVERALETERLRRDKAKFEAIKTPHAVLSGASAAARELRDVVERIAPTEGWVFITGESGVGKAMFAQAVHDASTRADGAFVHMNLAAIPRANVASQIFGVEDEGAIHIGQLETARGGTLVIDEVGDLEPKQQTQLLHVLESGKLVRINGVEAIDIDVRIISTTAYDVESMLQTGRLLAELYHRLNVLPVHIAPLKERLEDIGDLVSGFVDHFVGSEGLTQREFSAEAIARMREHQWLGNILELRNFVQRALIMVRGRVVNADDVDGLLGAHAPAPDVFDYSTPQELKLAREAFERDYFERLIQQYEGNITQVARAAGVERTHLYRKLKALGIRAK